jgi:S1-C subfamily serine protease
MGILSAVSGPWRTWRGGKLDAYLRLDTTTYPGTSGSLVIDSGGLTIGMATAGLSRLAPLAVPVDDRLVVSRLTHGHVGRGVGLQPIPLPSA